MITSNYDLSGESICVCERGLGKNERFGFNCNLLYAGKAKDAQ